MTRFTSVILLIYTLLASSCGGSREQKNAYQGEQNGLSGHIQLSGAFALYPMAVRWAEEFRKINPDVKIDISGGGAGKGMTDVLSGVVDAGMVSREVHEQETAKGAFAIAVVKDAVVMTVNADNPEIATIRKKGLTRATAARLWGGEITTWSEALGGAESRIPVHVFTRSDACGAGETFAAWFGMKQENLKATAVFGDPGVAAAVQKDRVGIGYNNIAYAYDQKSKLPFAGLAVAPIDVNENGVIDPEEDFYDTSEALVNAISENRYPSPPARDLYLVTKGKPEKAELIAFLNFILTEGQKFVAETGYIGLANDKLNSEKERLN
ncbi:MAG: substrate-binding domain-containing protein [Tannerella sp.]|jgi:phosphate transport system substrate-binding protein|nr:substrate-binding domain-containing protein [Tannerella sp.]